MCNCVSCVLITRHQDVTLQPCHREDMRKGWRVHWLTMMLWSNLTKCGLFFNIESPLWSTHFLHLCYSAWIPMAWKLSSWSSKKSSTADMTSSSVRCCFPARCFFIFNFGEQKIVRWCQIRGISIKDWSTSSKPQSHTAAIDTAELCAGGLSWWNRAPFISFPGRFQTSLVSYFSKL